MIIHQSTGRPSGTTKTLGSMIRGFKIGVTKWMRQNMGLHDVWQRDYHDLIIRDEHDLNRIREYIVHNPLKWAERENNPLRSRKENL